MPLPGGAYKRQVQRRGGHQKLTGGKLSNSVGLLLYGSCTFRR